MDKDMTVADARLYHLVAWVVVGAAMGIVGYGWNHTAVGLLAYIPLFIGIVWVMRSFRIMRAVEAWHPAPARTTIPDPVTPKGADHE